MHLQGGDPSNASAECTSVEALGDCLMFDDIDMPKTRVYLEGIIRRVGPVAVGTSEPIFLTDSLVFV
jgi:hypothetical protein